MKQPKGEIPGGRIPRPPKQEPSGLGKIPICSAPMTGSAVFHVLSTHMVLIGIHWDPNGRGEGRGVTVPCLGSPAMCIWCHRKQRVKAKGYLAAIEKMSRRQWTIEITDGAMRANPEIEAADGQLRGRWIQLGRLTHESRNAPAFARLLPGRDTEGLPLAWDVQAYLQRLFGYDARVFRVLEQPPPQPFEIDPRMGDR